MGSVVAVITFIAFVGLFFLFDRYIREHLQERRDASATVGSTAEAPRTPASSGSTGARADREVRTDRAVRPIRSNPAAPARKAECLTGKSWHYETEASEELLRSVLHRFVVGPDEDFEGLTVIEENDRLIRYGMASHGVGPVRRAWSRLLGRSTPFDWEAVVLLPVNGNHRVVFGFTQWHEIDGTEVNLYGMQKIKYRVDATVRSCDPRVHVGTKGVTPIVWM